MNPRNEQTAQMQPNQAMKARLSQTYGQQSRQVLEEQWILNHLPLVKHIVNKLVYHSRSRSDVEDLVSAGTLGLIKAAKSFDENRDVEFKTYAYIRIRGAIIDEMRKNSFVPSAVHQKIREIENTYREMNSRDGRAPRDEELARAVGISVEKLYDLLEQSRRQQFLSIHGLSDDKPTMQSLVPPDTADTPAEAAERKEMLEAMTQAILDLPERDRHILLLYYERDLTMRETAEVLGVTESRVSQLHAAALFKLSMKLGRQP